MAAVLHWQSSSESEDGEDTFGKTAPEDDGLSETSDGDLDADQNDGIQDADEADDDLVQPAVVTACGADDEEDNDDDSANVENIQVDLQETNQEVKTEEKAAVEITQKKDEKSHECKTVWEDTHKIDVSTSASDMLDLLARIKNCFKKYKSRFWELACESKLYSPQI